MADSIQHNHLPEILSCKMCNYYTCDKKQYNKHFLSNKHIKKNSTPIPDPVLVPESLLPSPSLHIETANKLSLKMELPEAPPNTPNTILCKLCNKTYKSQRTFAHHRCKKQPVVEPVNSSSKKEDSCMEEELELISDDEDDDDVHANEFEYMHIDPLIINHDVMYFMQALMQSMDFIKNIFIYINQFLGFFLVKSKKNNSD